MSALHILILASIFVAIALGYKLKINVGWFAIAFAFIFGIFGCGFSPNKIIGMWPTKLFFQLLSVMFFYNFAINNGTLALLAKKIVYLVRKSPALVPVALWVMFFVLTGVGPGSVAMFLALAPLLMSVAEETDMNPLLVPVIMTTAGAAGGWSPVAVQGLLTESLIENAGVAEMAHSYMIAVWRNQIICGLIVFAISYFVFRGFKCKVSNMEKPEAFSKQQSITLTLIVILLSLLVIPPVFGNAFGVKAFTSFANKMDITYLSIIFAIAAMVLRVGDEKAAVAKIPWSTIIMICGAGMLIAVASDAGVLDYLSTVVSDNISFGLLPVAVGIIAAVMSVFSSTTGVVMPTLYPIVATISLATGASMPMLFSIIPATASYAGISPFSTAGGLALAALHDEEQKNKLIVKLLLTALFAVVIVLVLAVIGIVR